MRGPQCYQWQQGAGDTGVRVSEGGIDEPILKRGGGLYLGLIFAKPVIILDLRRYGHIRLIL